MAPPQASAIYKKRDGTLTISKNAQVLSWTPVAPPGSKPAVSLAVSSITNLQQTPATTPKVMLKVFAQTPAHATPDTHVFQFTSPTQARAEADAIRDALSKAIQALKTGSNTPVGPGGGSSAAMAIASAVSSRIAPHSEAWYDDEKLKDDVELQQSLFKANPSLFNTFMESLRTKPESITNGQFTTQFWSSRLHLLRAHAIEKSQTKGSYNVLSTIKPRTEDNILKLNVTKEQIHLIFSQHPLVKRVYDENVPKLAEDAFWSRFFQSRLFKKLKGERIVESDDQDPILDKYLSQDEDLEREKRKLAAHIPHYIDLAGNEENHSQRQGNRPDMLMRPQGYDKVPIIRTLNSLSEKILSHVAPNDVDPSQPIGMDEATFDQLALRDLQGDAEENRIILNIRDQSRLFQSEKEAPGQSDSIRFAKQDPREVLSTLLSSLSASSHQPLAAGIGYDEDSSDSETEQVPPLPQHVGSKRALRAASRQTFDLIAQQRAQNDDLSSAQLANTASSAGTSLSSALYDRLLLTHATTTEFLHHFWSAFLSGDPSRAEEIGKLVETLDRAMDRIKAVADDAEKERKREVERLKRQLIEHYERHGRKLPFDEASIKGGSKEVNQLMTPTVKAIGVATGKYQEALREAQVEMQAQGQV